ncbi:NAD(P)H-dependent oxidoreductase [Kineosporia sp. NBRC 101731]|uniref:FMN-dependent NADH-azoreductase n=1 Tax=Kineosporia sp. NBRC 101731 TaxID=3032199 RepID=UPI0024A358C2|nr:NAD(P)H-dependent oxidoreductase [Kineosporia sp. NBRC 101731]GLY27260.1 FMN-dependent NADH-azoreductase [Kineosporia sp. NBRC 101731]
MTLFRLDASIRPQGSATREIGDIVEQEWLAAHPDDRIERRHVGVDVLPADAWGLAVDANLSPESEHTPAHRQARALAATLVDELLAADALLFAVPLYNYGVSQHFKTYGDLVWTDPRAHGQRFLEGKKAVLVTARGGAYGEGTPRAGWDHATPFMRRILADVWGADLTVIEREFTLVGTLPEFDRFADMATAMHTQALETAREAGKALGAL